MFNLIMFVTVYFQRTVNTILIQEVFGNTTTMSPPCGIDVTKIELQSNLTIWGKPTQPTETGEVIGLERYLVRDCVSSKGKKQADYFQVSGLPQ